MHPATGSIARSVKHGALLDAQLLPGQVYIELTGGRQIGLGCCRCSGDGEPAALRSASAVDWPVREPRPHFASLAELARHRSFLAKIVDPLRDRFLAPTSERGAA